MGGKTLFLRSQGEGDFFCRPSFFSPSVREQFPKPFHLPTDEAITLLKVRGYNRWKGQWKGQWEADGIDLPTENGPFRGWVWGDPESGAVAPVDRNGVAGFRPSCGSLCSTRGWRGAMVTAMWNRLKSTHPPPSSQPARSHLGFPAPPNLKPVEYLFHLRHPPPKCRAPQTKPVSPWSPFVAADLSVPVKGGKTGATGFARGGGEGVVYLP